MNLHPLVVAIVVVDALGLLAIGLAIPTALRVVLHWAPGEASRAQLELERFAEQSTAYGRLGFALHAATLGLLITALNHVLPHVIPGAMCGFGALQAMPEGRMVLLLRAVSLAAFVVWLEIDRANGKLATGLLAPASARSLLVAAPLAAVSTWQTVTSLRQVNVQTPVSCCATVYRLVEGSSVQQALPRIGTAGVVSTVAGAMLIATMALVLRARSKPLGPWIAASLGVAVAAWSAVGVWTLVDEGAPYIYGVMGHRCPFCLMLPAHAGVGYVVYGAVAVAMADALRLLVDARLGDSGNDPEALRVRRRRLVRVAVAVVVFVAASLGPALWWRARHGVWYEAACPSSPWSPPPPSAPGTSRTSTATTAAWYGSLA